MKSLASLFLSLLSFAVVHAQSIVDVTNADYTCAQPNRLVVVTASTAPVNITLPAATFAGQMIDIIVNDGTNSVTVRIAGTDQLIDPSNAEYMGGSCAAGEAVTLLSDGAGKWYVTGSRNNGCTNWSKNTSGGNTIPQGTTQGDLLYWDGSKWTIVPATNDPSLVLHGGTAPFWGAAQILFKTQQQPGSSTH